MYVLSRLRSVAKLGNLPMHFRRFRQNFIIRTVLGSTHLGQVKQTHSNKQRARLTTQRTRAELNGTTTRCQTVFFKFCNAIYLRVMELFTSIFIISSEMKSEMKCIGFLNVLMIDSILADDSLFHDYQYLIDFCYL